eukprot:Gb_17464 [translate_table: standard]
MCFPMAVDNKLFLKKCKKFTSCSSHRKFPVYFPQSATNLYLCICRSSAQTQKLFEKAIMHFIIGMFGYVNRHYFQGRSASEYAT